MRLPLRRQCLQLEFLLVSAWESMPDKKVMIVMPDSLIEALDRSAATSQRSRSAEVRVLLLAALSGGSPVARAVAAAPVPTDLCGGCRTGKHWSCDNKSERYAGTCGCVPCLESLEKDQAEKAAWEAVLAAGALPPARTRRVPRPAYKTGKCAECLAGAHATCALKADDYSPESGVILCSCDCVGWTLEQKRAEWLRPYDEVGVDAGICDACSRGECSQCDWHKKRGLCVCSRCKDSAVMAEVTRWVR